MKKTKKSNIPQKEDEKNIFFYGSTMSCPWTKHILPFVCQYFGSNMTLGSCPRYIELCPAPFGYCSKLMESLCCLLNHELMSMSCCLSWIIYCNIVQGKFLPSMSRPLCSLSLSRIIVHPERPIKSFPIPLY